VSDASVGGMVGLTTPSQLLRLSTRQHERKATSLKQKLAKMPAQLPHRQRRSSVPDSQPSVTIDRADIVRDGVCDLASCSSSQSGVWNDARVAVKRCVPTVPLHRVLREVARYMDLPPSAHNVVVYGVCLTPTVSLVVQLCVNGNMHDVLYGSRAQPFSPADRLALATGTARGLAFLHRHGFVHGNVSARHVLLDESNAPRLADVPSMLAQSLSYSTDGTQMHNSCRWWAPERFTAPHPATAAADAWALAVVFFEIYAASLPYQGLHTNAVMAYVTSGGRLAIPPSAPAPIAAALRELWVPKPTRRPTVRRIIKVLSGTSTASHAP